MKKVSRISGAVLLCLVILTVFSFPVFGNELISSAQENAVHQENAATDKNVADINTTETKIPAFPGAEGYGAYASGGRGGEVYEVTNLNDSGPGSLRDAVSQPNRTVVFRVSGTINLKSALRIKGNITIAGQTAPGEGICVKGYPTIIDGDNVIIRYMRFRLGDENGLKSDSLDINGRQNIILDHCSLSWGVDEILSAYGNSNVTIQWCMITEGLNNTNHSCGGLWGPRSSYHHNIIASNKTRNPKFAYLDNDIVDFRNNVIYNWGEMSCYTGSNGSINIVANYFKPGPSTLSDVGTTIVEPEPTCSIYCADNYFYGSPEVTTDNWKGVAGECIKSNAPHEVPPVTTYPAEQAYYVVLAKAGASLPVRDAVDKRIIEDIINGTGSIILSQDDVGGYPELKSAEPPVDSDHDGMPDEWEIMMGLNPEDPSDRNGDMDGDGYTNLEDYINSLTHNGRHWPVIRITSPVTNSFFEAPADIVINVDAFDVDGTIKKVEFYNGTNLIGEVTRAPYSFTWKKVPDGVYSITAKAIDDSGLVTESEAVEIYVNEEAVTLPWFGMDLGETALEGISSVKKKVFTVKSSGRIGGYGDSCHYLFQKLNGDGEIIAKIDSIIPVTAGAEAGIMMRSDLETGSPAVMLGVSYPNSGDSDGSTGPSLQFKYRKAKGETMELLASTGRVNSFPCWLKLSREGNLFTAYVSQDGRKWNAVGSITVEMPYDVYIGLAAGSGESAGSRVSYVNASFSGVELTGEVAPVIFPDQDSSIINRSDYFVSGLVNKRCMVVLTVNGKEVGKQKVDKDLRYWFNAKLKEGENVITVEAYTIQVIVNGRVVAEIPSDIKLKLDPGSLKVKPGKNRIILEPEEPGIGKEYEVDIFIEGEEGIYDEDGIFTSDENKGGKNDREFPVEIRRVSSRRSINVVLDTIAPVINPDVEDVTVNEALFTLAGSVNEESIVKIRVNDGEIREITTDENLRYSMNVNLQLGINNIWLQAVDLAGNVSADKNITVVLVDNTPPVVEYVRELLQHETFTVNVTDDLSGVKECIIRIGDQTLKLEELRNIILPPGEWDVYIKAVDMYGNVSEISFTTMVFVYADTLEDVVNKGWGLGLIQDSDTREILANKANMVFIDRFNAENAITRLDEFCGEVEMQLLNNKIDEYFASILFQDTQYLKNLYLEGRVADAVSVLYLKFDFGPGPVAIGYTQVLKDTVYTSLLGYGLSGGANLDVRNRSLADDLRRDFVVGDNFEFKVDLPNGKYFVTLISGDKDAVQAAFDVKAEGTVVLEGVSAPKGSFAERTFEVEVTDCQLNLEFIGRIIRINALDIVPLK